MKKYTYIFAFLVAIVIIVGCNTKKITTTNNHSVLNYVDPFIGTGGHVHTFPGATVPFGMVQLSPDGDVKGWDWCSGYHQSDSSLMGFSHTHLSGTGWTDLGDILLMPTVGEIKLIPGEKANPDEGYRSRFSHDNEEASPGYYRVFLEDYGIDAELTTTERVGMHRYTFPASEQSNVIIDPTHKIFGKTLKTSISLRDENTISGVCETEGWGGKRYIFFTAKFSKNFDNWGMYVDGVGNKEGTQGANGKDAKAWVSFKTTEGEQIEVKVAISQVSQEGADKNLKAEVKGKNFDIVLAEAKAKWEEKIGRIKVSGGTEDQKKIFYTGLYHNFIAPNLNMDVDGQYWALDTTLQAKGFNNYSSFSLWDTFRGTHPLLTIIDQKHTAEFAKSLISRHTQAGKTMPMWELCGYDNRCMIGYHSSSVIWDAIAKGVPGINEEEAFDAMHDAAFVDKKSSSDGEGGMSSYIKYDYIPHQIDKSVAKTLEFAYCDWTVGQLAERLGKTKEAAEFQKRAKSFENLWDADMKRFWMKDEQGNWHKDFPLNDWKTLQPHYVSGNFWAYEYFVPHNMERLVELRGGKDGMEKSLDKLFSESVEMVGDQHVDISGFIGMYGHGDEPGHHIPYLYNYTNSPWKSQEMINQLKNTMYSAKTDGMINNEDCGQMSAWYVFASLGFYPVCPGKPVYDIGTPTWDKAEITLENGNVFTIIANKVSPENIYVQSVSLNGEKLNDLFLKHEEIMKGGKLVFEMSNKPQKR